MQVYITAIEEGFLYGLLALGIYISLRILDIPDLTTEGSFGFGYCCKQGIERYKLYCGFCGRCACRNSNRSFAN